MGKTLKKYSIQSFSHPTATIPFGLLALLAFVLGFQLVSSNPSYAATPLATVNGTVITLEDFNTRYSQASKLLPLNPPAKKDFLDEMVKREVAIHEAKRLALEKNPEIVDRIHNVLYQGLIEKKLGKEFEAIQVTDEQAKSYYEKYPEIRTSHILIAVPANSSAEIQKKALERIKTIQTEYLRNQDKVTFSELAQRNSESPTASIGGDIDYQTRDRLDPAYYAAALKLKKPGSVSDIVRTSFGYHLIKLTGIRTWEETDQAQVKRMVFEEQRAKIFDKFMAQLKANAKISIRAELLKN